MSVRKPSADVWDAINCYAEACGATPSARVYGALRRQQAVVDVERALETYAAQKVRAAVDRELEWSKSQDMMAARLYQESIDDRKQLRQEVERLREMFYGVRPRFICSSCGQNRSPTMCEQCEEAALVERGEESTD